MSIKLTVCSTIKTKRLESGLSQDKLAARADISTRHYQTIESGVSLPSIDTVFKLSKALGLHYSDIISPAWESWTDQ